MKGENTVPLREECYLVKFSISTYISAVFCEVYNPSCLNSCRNDPWHPSISHNTTTKNHSTVSRSCLPLLDSTCRFVQLTVWSPGTTGVFRSLEHHLVHQLKVLDRCVGVWVVEEDNRLFPLSIDWSYSTACGAVLCLSRRRNWLIICLTSTCCYFTTPCMCIPTFLHSKNMSTYRETHRVSVSQTLNLFYVFSSLVKSMQICQYTQRIFGHNVIIQH